MTGLLSGLRVLDLSGITAGGRTTQILGDFGADVIKLEGPRRPDPFRHWTAVTGSTGLGDLGSPAFRVVNRNKRGLAIDLKRPESRAIVQRLVERSDIVVENFRREVMDRLGLSYATLREWNPAVVLLSLSSQGGTGPERFNVSFGSTLEALGGLMAMTGYDRDTPTWSTNKVNYPDQTVSSTGSRARGVGTSAQPGDRRRMLDRPVAARGGHVAARRVGGRELGHRRVARPDGQSRPPTRATSVCRAPATTSG